MTNSLLNLPPTKIAKVAAQKFLPHHEQCMAININPKEPIAQDRLLNELFPFQSKFDWDWSTSEGESEIAENINRYLDVLCEVYVEHSCLSSYAIKP